METFVENGVKVFQTHMKPYAACQSNVILKINVMYQKALCPIRNVPSTGNHDDPLSYYQIGDLIRGMMFFLLFLKRKISALVYKRIIRLDKVMFYATAGVKDIDRYHEKLTLSLYSSSLATHLNKVKLGVISKEDLPLHYTYVESGKRTFTHLSQTSCRLLSLPLFQPG